MSTPKRLQKILIKISLFLFLTAQIFVSCVCELNPPGNPEWREQGPGPIHMGQVEGMDNRPVAGAVTSIAPHPLKNNILYIGTVNGGVWRTETATANSPSWTPLTDHMPSLSIGAVALSPLDQNFRTIYAGTGSFSSGARRGGPAIGIYKSLNGGDSWQIIGDSLLAGRPIRTIIPAAVAATPANDPVLLVATTSALFRSADGGATFGVAIAGNTTSLVGDPNNNNQFFAAIPGSGVFRSTDAGANWQATANIPDPLALNPTSIKLAMSATTDANGQSPLYAALSSGSTASVLRSSDSGNSWDLMLMPTTYEGLPFVGNNVGPFPGQQSATHFSLAADPNSAQIVYLGGDRQPGWIIPTASGTVDYSGRLFIGDFSQQLGQMWSPLVGSFAGGSSPHADSRDIKFDITGNMYQADDGGIYKLSSPRVNEIRKWSSLNGNLRISEMYSIGYDSHNDVLIGGTQDVGSVEQVLPADTLTPILWRDARLFSFFQIDFFNQEGDGGYVAVDNRSKSDASIRYTMGNNLHMFFRREYNDANPGAVLPAWLNFPGEGSIIPFSGLHNSDTNTGGFRLTRIALNTIDPNSIIIGDNALYESRNQGGNVTIIDNPRRGRRVAALAYGGRNTNGTDRAGLIYASRGNELSVRSGFTANWNRRFLNDSTFSSASDSVIRDIVVDPDNWRTAYLVTQKNVYRIENVNQDDEVVTDITGNLSDFSSYYDSLSASQNDIDLRCIEIYKPAADTTAIFVGGMGGVYRLRFADIVSPATLVLWDEFGIKLPNVLVMDLLYDASDDLLAAGTFGRGVWTIHGASKSMMQPKFRLASGQIPPRRP